MSLVDGRLLSYDVYGDPEGVPVIFSHGFSDSRLIRNPDDALTASLGVRVIAADQPGVGGSSPLPGRRMVDWGADMEQLADHLGLDTFVAAGHSGGGPHALSIAHHMPQRVTRVVLASPVGPFDKDGFSKMLAMKDLKLIVRLHHFHHLLRFGYKATTKKAHRDVDAYFQEIVKGDPSDAQTFLRSPEQQAMFEANFAEGIAQDEEGLYEMTQALWDWGFDLADIHTPATVFYGDADDIIEPQMPALVSQMLHNSEARVWPGAGHYGFVDPERWSEFFIAARGD